MIINTDNSDDNSAVGVDYFDIEVEDRISVSGDIPIGDAEREQLRELGIPGASTFSEIRFFTNAFGTTTRGVDVVASYPWELVNGALLELTASVNYTDTEVDDISNPTAIDRERELELEDFVPNTRGNISFHCRLPKFSALVRGNFYGEWTDYGSTPDGDQTFGEEWLVDVELSYHATENWTLQVGGENIFDNYPDREERQSNLNFGLVYPRFAPIGFNGGFWYFRARTDF